MGASKSKSVDIRLNFVSDTSSAKAALKDLTTNIVKLKQTALTDNNFGFNKELQKGVEICNTLEMALKRATSSTGNLDLYDFRKELEKANLDANKIGDSLRALGPEGVNAFNQLTHSIANAEMPLKRTNKLLEEFRTTLKNTVRWQISSTAINALANGMHQAYSYAQDLNSSLNDIRIVTGKSTDEMVKFAKEANKSAKALSATTLAYTDASLIYYQQGLDTDEVKERTDTTIKMSNVTKDSVKDTSSAMTAVWNNFADGTKNLEYYGDVIVELGAKTAASSSEITTGLSKFASIGKTVGLSFEYATAALATIIDKTRQSEDIVGTALKTIFSRIQSLSLGETLDDGLNLTKYSKGLKAIGVEVLNADGSLKKLDETLEDVGSKWKTLSAAEKTALAQTVAGTRQYAQFIALMDNWGDVQKNVAAARNSSGALQKQADIYAESWEAARKRVQASLQKIYTQIIEDKTFIKLTDAVSKFVDGISNVIEGLGGVKGLLASILPIALKLFKSDISGGITRFNTNLVLGRKQTQKENRAFQASWFDTGGVDYLARTTMGQNATSYNNFQNRMSAQGVAIPEDISNKYKFLQTKLSIFADEQEALEANPASLSGQNLFTNPKNQKRYQLQLAGSVTNQLLAEQSKSGLSDEQIYTKVKGYFANSGAKAVNEIFDREDVKTLEDFIKAIKDATDTLEDFESETQQVNTEEKSAKKVKVKRIETSKDTITIPTKDIKNKKQDSTQAQKEASQVVQSSAKNVKQEMENTAKVSVAQIESEAFREDIENYESYQTFSESLVDIVAQVGAVVAAFNTLDSAIDICFDDNLTGIEKFTAVIGSVGSSALTLGMSFEPFLRNTKAFKKVTEGLDNFITGFSASLSGVGKSAAAGGAQVAGLGSSMAGVGAAAASALPWILAIIAAFAVIKVVIKAVDEHFEDAVESSKKYFEETSKQTEELKAQQDALESLTQKYKEYGDSLNEEQLHNLRMETYELCKQYGKQDLAVKALSASYQDLKNITDTLGDFGLSELKKSYETQAQAGQATLSAISDQKGWEQTKNSVLLSLIPFGTLWQGYENIEGAKQGVGSNRIEVAGDRQSEMLLRQMKTLGVATTDQGLIDADQLLAAATGNNSDELYRMLNTSSSKASREILEFLQENADIIDAVKNTNEELNNIKVKEEFTNFNGTLEQYRQKTEELAQALYGDISDENLQKVEDKVISTIDDIADYATKNNLIKKLLEEGWEESDAISFVNELKDSEINYLTNSAAARGRAKSGKTINSEDRQVLANYEKAYQNSQISGLLSTDTEGKSYSQSMVESIFESDGFGEYIDASGNKQKLAGTKNATEFSRQSLGRQQTIAIAQLLNNPVSANDLWRIKEDQKNAAVKASGLQGELDKQNTEAYNKFFEETLKNPAEVEKTFSAYDLSGETIDLLKNPDKLKEFLLKDIDQMSEVEKANFDALKDALSHFDGTNLSEIREITNIKDQLDKANQEVENYRTSLQKLEATYEQIQKAIENTNQEIDSLQSAFSSMISAQDEYNEQGYLSVDTLQSVLALGDEYLKYLIDTKGNLNLDKQALIEMTKARIEDLAIQEAQLAIARLQKLQLGTAEERKEDLEIVAAATKRAAESNRDYAESLLEMIDAEAIAAAQKNHSMATEIHNYAELAKAKLKLGLQTSDNYTGESSSSSSKSSSKKENKDYADEFDRYYEINENLQAISHSMDMIAEQQQHLFGNALAKSLRDTNNLLEEQREQLKALRGEQLEEQGELQASLGKDGLQFDKYSGQIVNYAEATAAALKRYNDAVTAYNASAKDSAADAAFQAEEQRFNNFKEELSRYDALISELQQNERDLQSNYFEQLGNELNAWRAEIQVKLDFAEADKAWAEFVGKISENFKDVFKDVSSQLSSIANQMNASLSSFSINRSAANTIMRDIDKMIAGGQSDKFASVSEAQEELKGYRDVLIAEASSMYDLYRSAWDGYLEGIDQAIQKFEDLNSEYEDINSMLEHQGQMIKLLYGDDAFGLKDKQYSAQADTSLARMESLKEQQAFYEEMYKQEVRRNGEDSVSAKKWKDAWSQSIKDLQQEEINFIETIQKEATNSIENIFNLLEKKIGNGKTLTQISEQWKDIKKSTDGYYDAVERVSEINEMEYKWQKAIENTSGLKNQQRLKTLMDDQLDSLKDKNKLSEYDITLAEKRLAVYQAQIALEDAQNNKNAMKLTRGTDGNWSYQYVADTDEIADKEQELMEKNNDYYAFVKESWTNTTESIVTDTQEAMRRIAELEQQALTADTDKQAEIAAQIEYLKEYYWGESGVLILAMAQQAQMETDLNQATAETLWGLYQTNADNYTIMTDTQKSLIDSLKEHGVTSYESLNETIKMSYDDIMAKSQEVNTESLSEWTAYAAEMCRLWNSTDGDSIKQNVTKALDSCTNVLNKYFLRVEQGSIAAGEDITDVAAKVDMLSERVENLTGVTEDLARDSAAALEDYYQKLQDIEEQWDAIREAIEEANRKIQEYLRLQGLEVQKMEDYQKSPPITTITKGEVAGFGGNGGGSSTTPTSKLFSLNQQGYDALSIQYNGKIPKEILEQYDLSKVKLGGNLLDSYAQTEMSKLGYNTNGYAITYQYNANGKLKEQNNSNKKLTDEELLRRFSGVKLGFDTGGYTGAWGNSGKLAVLHEKELVLNKEDTQNILSAVDLVRNMGSLLNELNIKMLSGTTSQHYSSEDGIGSQPVFNITAEFPNATDVESIREALLSLPTLASQYLS